MIKANNLTRRRSLENVDDVLLVEFYCPLLFRINNIYLIQSIIFCYISIWEWIIGSFPIHIKKSIFAAVLRRGGNDWHTNNRITCGNSRFNRCITHSLFFMNTVDIIRTFPITHQTSNNQVDADTKGDAFQAGIAAQQL